MVDLTKLSDEELVKLYQANKVDTPEPRRSVSSDWNRLGWEGFRGLADKGHGIMQIGAHGVDALAGTDLVSKLDERSKRSEAFYRTKRPADGSFEWGRAIAPAAYDALLFKNMAPAAGLFGRMKQGMGVGIESALTTPIEEGDDFAKRKSIQTGIGAGLGLAMPPVLESAIAGGGALINKAAQMGRAGVNAARDTIAPQNTQQLVNIALHSKGVDLSALNSGLQKSLIAEADKALKVNGKLDPDALARLVDFKALGIKPLTGWLTRNPVQYSTEMNLRGTTPGQPIQQAINTASTKLFDSLDNMRGGSNMSPYEAGQQAITALKSVDASKKGTVTAAYDALRNNPNLQKESVPLLPIQTAVGKVLQDYGDDAIPKNVITRLHEYGLSGQGTPSKTLTVQEAEKLKTLLNNNAGNDRSTQSLTKILKDSIDDAYTQMGNKEASDLASKARGLAHERFQWQDMVPAAKAVVENRATPDDFIKQYVLNANTKEISNMMLSLDGQTQQALKAQVVNHLANKAGESVHGELGAFSQAAYNKELARLGKERLTALFGKDGYSTLTRVGRVAESVGRFPAGDSVNTSKTAGVLLGQMGKAMGGLQYANPIIDFATKSSQVSRALDGSIAPYPYQLINPEAINRFGARFGLLGGPLGLGAYQGAKK